MEKVQGSLFQVRNSALVSELSSTMVELVVVLVVDIPGPSIFSGMRLNQERTNLCVNVSAHAGPVTGRAIPTSVRVASPDFLATPVVVSVT